jgi:uncharacterized coiled-coil protein SlyX
MPSFLKKRSETEELPVLPAWHPNFRNTEKLPDTKVVRTAFFVNGIAIFAALSLGTFLAFREWQLNVLNNQIAQVQSEITRNKVLSDRAVAAFKSFQSSEAKVAEVETFIISKPSVSVLVLRLAQTLPSNIAIDTLDLRDAGMTLRLSIRGDAAAASGYATAYLDQLRKDKELSLFDDFSFTGSPVRNPATGRMAVEFMLRLKPALVPAKKKS